MPLLPRLLPFALAALARAQELPTPAARPLEFEPQLILTDPATPATAGGATMDTAKLEAALQRAKRNAVTDEGLYKKGVLAKVEAERSALKVVQLTKRLAEARLLAARTALDNLKEGTAEAKAAAEAAVREAEQAAQAGAEAWQQAQLDAAALNLWRVQKLQAWGYASRSAVARAQEQVLALQGGAPATPPATPAAKNRTSGSR